MYHYSHLMKYKMPAGMITMMVMQKLQLLLSFLETSLDV